MSPKTFLSNMMIFFEFFDSFGELSPESDVKTSIFGIFFKFKFSIPSGVFDLDRFWPTIGFEQSLFESSFSWLMADSSFFRFSINDNKAGLCVINRFSSPESLSNSRDSSSEILVGQNRVKCTPVVFVWIDQSALPATDVSESELSASCGINLFSSN